MQRIHHRGHRVRPQGHRIHHLSVKHGEQLSSDFMHHSHNTNLKQLQEQLSNVEINPSAIIKGGSLKRKHRIKF